MNSNISNTNHVIEWTNKINCDKTATKIKKQNIVVITNNKIIIANIDGSFYQINPQSINPPNFIKHKIKNVYKNSNGVILIIYENYTTYLRCDEELVGKLY